MTDEGNFITFSDWVFCVPCTRGQSPLTERTKIQFY